MNSLPNIVVVGGGAGGFELVVRLGHLLGKSQKARIILVDSSPTHLWKPLLHEVAAGTLNSHEDEVDYLAHAAAHYYYFQRGSLRGLKRSERKILLAPVMEREIEIIPARELVYDYLVLALGSVGNDFGTPGAKEHCLFLDDYRQANAFHQQFIANLMSVQYQHLSRKIDIAIVGAGATGVELAAELHYSARQAKAYGLDKIQPERDISISLIEAADKILPALPAALSKAVTKQLKQMGIKLCMAERVNKISAEGLEMVSGRFVPATLKVWAAGIKAADILQQLDGLETNHNNQLVIKDTLQTTRDTRIFALGDCAYCVQVNGKVVPPRAQAAHQQATLLANSFVQLLQGNDLLHYRYRDYGSLITLSKHQTVGNLMGRMTNVFIEGKIARFMYLLLYKYHQVVLFGIWRVCLLTIANGLTRKAKPRLKLH